MIPDGLIRLAKKVARTSGRRYPWLTYHERLSAAFLALCRNPHSRRPSMMMLDQIREDARYSPSPPLPRAEPVDGPEDILEARWRADQDTALLGHLRGLSGAAGEVLRGILDGEEQQAIARRLGVSPGRVSQIKAAALREVVLLARPLQESR